MDSKDLFVFYSKRKESYKIKVISDLSGYVFIN